MDTAERNDRMTGPAFWIVAALAVALIAAIAGGLAARPFFPPHLTKPELAAYILAQVTARGADRGAVTRIFDQCDMQETGGGMTAPTFPHDFGGCVRERGIAFDPPPPALRWPW